MGRVTVVMGTAILAGIVEGEALASDTPLSFWGGFDPTPA